MLGSLLATFVFRLSFGMAVAMAWTPYRFVNSGFYRVHLWVLLGLNTFAALAVGSQQTGVRGVLALSILAAVASYLGAVVWMYEAAGPGQLALYLVALLDLVAALLVSAANRPEGVPDGVFTVGMWSLFADVVTSGLLLGLTMSAMLLGHWYLNTPSMQLRPLQQLIVAMVVVVLLRGLVCGSGLAAEVSQNGIVSTGWCGLVALRWLSGLFGVAGLAFMTWQTLKIPNTQSATGILYVAVIFSFMGELSSQLLASSSSFPL